LLPIEGIETQAVNPLFLPGNTMYVCSIERIQWRGSHVRECVFGGASVPRLVFLPIVDYPLMGKNFNPVGNYAQAAAEMGSSALDSHNRARNILPMTRKLAIECVRELVENYRGLGLTDLPLLTNLTREQVGQIYMAVLPPYVTKPGLEGIKRAITMRADGKSIFDVNAVTMLDSKGQEAEFDLARLLEDISGRNYLKTLPPELSEIAVQTQQSLSAAIENAMVYRRDWIDRETNEIAASKTNGGRGLSSYTHLAKKYAVSLNLELIDPVVVQRKEFVKEASASASAAPAMPVVVENPSNDRLADALDKFSLAIESLQLQVPAATATTTRSKPKNKES